VTYSGRNVRIEEMRCVKVGNQNLVDHVRVGGIFGWVCDLDQVFELLGCHILDFAACRGDSRRRYQPITARIDQHFQAFVTRGERPRGPSIDQRIRLLVVGQVEPCGTVLPDVIDNKYWEHARLDGFGIGQSRDRGGNVPNILQISGRLNIQRGSDLNKVAKPNRRRPRGYSDSPGEHDGWPLVDRVGSRTSFDSDAITVAT